jgi:dTMP kinase
MSKRGYFISFEGPEGSGKSTQIRALNDYLSEKGYETVTSREPGGTMQGELMRDMLQHDDRYKLAPESEVFVFSASRRELVNNVIEPALLNGKIVLQDRFADSTTAYQAYGRELDLATVMAINNFAIGDNWPDLTFLLDLPPEVGLARQRRGQKAPDKFEREDMPFHRAVRKGYLEIAAQNPDRFAVVDAARSSDVIQSEIIAILDERLKLS